MASYKHTYQYQPSVEYAKHLLSYIPKRPDYDTWVRVVSAIGNTFGEKTALEILNGHFSEEIFNEHSSKLRNKLTDITFGTLVHYARKYGYVSDKKRSKGFVRTFPRCTNFKLQLRKEVELSPDRELLYRFVDDILEEQAAIYEYDAGLSRAVSDSRIIKENSNASQERLYRVSINYKILDKNLNPETRVPYSSYYTFTNYFNNEVFSLDEIIDAVGSGHTICFCHLKPADSGFSAHSNKNFLYSEMFALDFDGNMTIEDCLANELTKAALLLYTTCSSTESTHRFRLIFDLPRLIREPDNYRKVVKHYVKKYGSDSLCHDVARPFYGNRNADFIIVPTNKRITYRGGKLNE